MQVFGFHSKILQAGLLENLKTIERASTWLNQYGRRQKCKQKETSKIDEQYGESKSFGLPKFIDIHFPTFRRIWADPSTVIFCSSVTFVFPGNLLIWLSMPFLIIPRAYCYYYYNHHYNHRFIYSRQTYNSDNKTNLCLLSNKVKRN